MTRTDTNEQTRMRLGLLALLVALAAIGGAWAFQLIGGYIPCALCLQQRVPYYAGIPVLLAALLVLRFRPQLTFSRLLFFAFAVIMAYSLYLAIYHAGAEWEFWAGPSDCGGNRAARQLHRGGRALSRPVLCRLECGCNPAADRAWTAGSPSTRRAVSAAAAGSGPLACPSDVRHRTPLYRAAGFLPASR